MISVFNSHPYTVAVLILGLLFVTVMDASFLVSIFKRENMRLEKALFTISCIICYGMYVVYSTIVKSQNFLFELPSYLEPVAQMPLHLPVITLLLGIVILIFFTIKEMNHRRRAITSFSVKESFDYLDTGLCFSKENGSVYLVNYRMNALCHSLIGHELQNANAFWQKLVDGNVLPGVVCISRGEHPEYALPDGNIWSFVREEIDSITQITAADVTSLHNLTNRFKEKNTELEAMNLRLRKYGETVDETTKEKERLETKVRIHNEIGQALLRSRYCLQNDDTDINAAIENWKRNIAVLKMETVAQNSTSPLQLLFDAAESAGIKIHVDGDLPDGDDTRQLFVLSATEALTNAVRHADAKQLFIKFYQKGDLYFAHYTNDGSIPAKEIVEGGGLGYLRKKIERAGGNMQVLSKPQFELIVCVEKKGGAIL